MIEFLGLFLGLLTGPQPVAVAVTAADVAAVEIRLDGEVCGVDRRAPFEVECNFGAALLPRELVAVATNSNGQQIATARELVNLPGAQVEARFVVEPVGARLIWEERSGAVPRSVAVALDGEPLEVDRRGRVELPVRRGLLVGEVEFSDTLRAQAVAYLGGEYHDTTDSRLTAVPVLWDRRRHPAADDLAVVLTVDGQAAEVAAIDTGRAEVLIVREGSEWNLESLLDLHRHMRSRRGAIYGDIHGRDLRGVRPGDRLRVILTEEPPALRSLIDLPVSADISEGGRLSILESMTNRYIIGREYPQGAQRIADAVAMAGYVAAGSARPRAVILIRSGRLQDSSTLTPQQARAYLAALRVPLLVWRPLAARDGGTDGEWAGEVEIWTEAGLVSAVAELRKLLDRQVIAWIEGEHLPHRIGLARGVRRVRLPGEQTP